MPKRKFVLVASRGGKVNDEEIREKEAVPSAPATSMAEDRRSSVHEIKTIGRARVLEFRIDPQTGHIVKNVVANDDDGDGVED